MAYYVDKQVYLDAVHKGIRHLSQDLESSSGSFVSGVSA